MATSAGGAAVPCTLKARLLASAEKSMLTRYSYALLPLSASPACWWLKPLGEGSGEGVKVMVRVVVPLGGMVPGGGGQEQGRPVRCLYQ